MNLLSYVYWIFVCANYIKTRGLRERRPPPRRIWSEFGSGPDTVTDPDFQYTLIHCE